MVISTAVISTTGVLAVLVQALHEPVMVAKALGTGVALFRCFLSLHRWMFQRTEPPVSTVPAPR